MFNEEELRAKAERLGIAARELNEASDKLKPIILDLNEKINSLNIGLNTYVKMGEEGYYLGYGKLDKIWTLFVSRGDDIWPLFSAPRHVRLQAFDYIDGLLVNLLTNVEYETQRVANGAAKANQILAKLNL